jgi:hypothetical protein
LFRSLLAKHDQAKSVEFCLRDFRQWLNASTPATEPCKGHLYADLGDNGTWSGCAMLMPDIPDDLRQCEACDDTGKVNVEFREARISGLSVLFDPDLLVKWITPELLHYGESVTAWVGEHAKDRVETLRLQGENWRIVMASTKPDAERTRRLYVPGVGPIAHAETDPSGRGILADWYREHDEEEFAEVLTSHMKGGAAHAASESA